MITVVAGGVGAARFLTGLIQVVPATDISAVVNVGDDLVLHGLHISPDLDTVTYTVAGAIDPERGWGLAGESWQAMDSLERYGGESWFRLGDRDLGTHLYRTHRLGQGATLTEVTAEIAAAWNLGIGLLPVSDDPVRTKVVVDGEGEIDFQEYFVGRRHDVAITGVRFDGAADARPGPEVLSSITDADVVVIAPSNPIVSIDPVLAVPGVRAAVEAHPRVIAVSPIIGGAALKGPADRMLRELGHDSSVGGIAQIYASLASCLVIDQADGSLVADVEKAGMRCIVTDTVMSSSEVAASLAQLTIDEGRRL